MREDILDLRAEQIVEENKDRRRHKRRFKPAFLKRRARRRALVIGLSAYDASSQFPALPGVESDARELAELLEHEYNFSVEKIFGRCEGQALKDKRAEFVAKAENADVVFVAFVGHGILCNANTFLVPSSGSIGPIPRDFLQHCLDCNDLIRDVLEHTPRARHIFIFDACRKTVLEVGAASHYLFAPEAVLGSADIVVFSTSRNAAAVDSESFTRQLTIDLKDPSRHFYDALKDANEASYLRLGKQCRFREVTTSDIGTSNRRNRYTSRPRPNFFLWTQPTT
jgi:Caspase domain